MKSNTIGLGAKMGIAFATIALLAAIFNITACNGGGGDPSINSFTLLYDIVAIGDPAGASWASSNGDDAKITAVHSNGTVQYNNQVPVNSNGVHQIQTGEWPEGEYKVKLQVSNSDGTASRERNMLLVGPSGIWFHFSKSVYPNPKDDAWIGIENVPVPVSIGQGADDQNETISISKYVSINRIKWNVGAGAPWPDLNSCFGAKLMTIRKGNEGNVFEIEREYVFPWTGFTGNYYCTSIWEPCALTTDRGSWFILSLQVMSQL